ncbi:MAG: lipopolysaccharide transport periplasmic protein LptA [Nitrospinae bacterium]|nr:lipopolysaccharide transport periplasmic protein LptA [Nitrospinota bacterium]
MRFIVVAALSLLMAWGGLYPLNALAAGAVKEEPKGKKGAAGVFQDDQEDKKAPLQITSQRMVSDSKSNKISFFGDVVAVKGKLVVESEEMHVFSDDAQNELREMEALGSVKITHKDKVATGKKANYFDDSRTVVLTGDPVLTQGKNTATGEKVIYYFDREDMEIISGQGAPAKVILYQKEEQKPAGQAKPSEKPAQASQGSGKK